MENSLTLYGFSTEIKALQELLFMDQGEITPELEALQKEVYDLIERKTDSCVGFMTMLDDREEIIEKRIAEMTTLKRQIQKAKDSFKDYVGFCMDSAGVDKFQGDFGTITRTKASKVCQIDDEDKIPAEFTQVKVEVMKKEIKDALLSGQEVPGASIVDGKRSIRFSKKAVK